MNFINESAFAPPQKILVPTNTDIIFVNDFFANELIGGAELSTDALISAANLNIAKVKASYVTMELLEQFQNKYWIFTNIASMNADLIPTIASNIRYSAIVYDYCFCKYRSIEKHYELEKAQCNCSNEYIGKLMSTFMYQADTLWFMSEKQSSIWLEKFPFLAERDITVLSSIFSEDFFKTFAIIREQLVDGEIKKNDKFIVLDSPSWIKGTDIALKYCKENNIDYELVGGVSYSTFLNKLANSKGLVYLPPGGDTCPRLVIEAKLLGCELILNDNVQHKDEEWFNTDDLEIVTSYLYMCRQRFWNGIKNTINYIPTISGYTTTYNCIANDYPYIEAITSMLGFCNEVVIVDAGSTDGTYEALKILEKQKDQIKVFQKCVDFNKPRWAIELDGHLKAYARSLCTSVFCWQMDSDEVVHEDDYSKIKSLCANFPKSLSLLCLPVIEYFSALNKVRSRVAWKPRLSKNIPQITHDIPAPFRKYDDDGNVYVEPYRSDTCDYVDINSYMPIQAATFYPEDADVVRDANINEYEKWFDEATRVYPGVFHFSWFNLERKVKNYTGRYGWLSFHRSMYKLDTIDTMFNKLEPSNEEIRQKIVELYNHGPHIFHTKMSGETRNNEKLIKITRKPPQIINSWIERNTICYE